MDVSEGKQEREGVRREDEVERMGRQRKKREEGRLELAEGNA